MSTITNSFEGGTNGTAISTSNSGGASGTAFDSLGGSTTLPKFSTTGAIHGSMGASTPLSSNSTTTLEWKAAFSGYNSSSTPWYARDYFKITSLPPVQVFLMKAQDDVAPQDVWAVYLDTSGHLGLRNRVAGTNLATSTGTVALNTPTRWETKCVYNGSTYNLTLRCFFGSNVEGTTPDETLTASMSSTDAVDITSFGAQSATNTTWSTVYHDDIGLSSTGYLGPVSSGTTVSLPVAQVNVAAHAPGVTAGPVPLQVAQLNVVAYPPIPGHVVQIPTARVNVAAPAPGKPSTLALPVARVNVAAHTPTVVQGASLGVAQVNVAAPAPTVTTGWTVPLPVAGVRVEAPAPGVQLPYTVNECVNPSFEAGLSGWAELVGTVTEQDSTYAAYGQSAMLVVTDGSASGEGFYGPQAFVPADLPCSASMYFYSVTGGTVTLSAVSAATGQVLGSAQVTLTDSWQRAEVSGFVVTGGDSFYMLVQTTTPEALTFWVDAAQMQLNTSHAAPYIDGDQNGCRWLGQPELSASVKPYQNATSAAGSMRLEGRAAPVTIGETFSTSASGSMTLTGDAAPSSVTPVAAFDDFAIFELTDPDPAMTYADQNNAGTNSGLKAWVEGYGLFYPPLDYPVSGGNYAWRRAQYMAAGFKFGSVAAGEPQNISLVQVALTPITGSAPVPLAYTPPRQLQTIIKPTRLNFCPNPSFEVSTSGWSGVGTGTVSQDSTTSPSPGYVTIAQAQNLGSYANAVSISQDGASGTANFDGTGKSYSAQALADVGAVPGAIVSSDGIDYVMPSAPAGTPDSIRAAGQTIPVPGPTGPTAIAFLGASTAGGGSGIEGTFTITYTDGSTNSLPLGFTEWDLPGSLNYANTIAVSMEYRNERDGDADQTDVYLFSSAVPINSDKAVASITLPSNADLVIFAVSLAQAVGSLTGTNSGKVTVSANGDGTSISIADLILGDTYTASLYVQAGAGLSDIIATCGTGSATASNVTGGIPYGGQTGTGYGQGPYGGVAGGSTDLPTGQWNRISFTFTAQASTETFSVTAVSASDVSYPTDFWVDGVLIEAGGALGSYFDGSYTDTISDDYAWETGGTAGLTRSYFYQQLTVKQQTINQILNQHTPLGITYATPTYLQPYSQ